MDSKEAGKIAAVIGKDHSSLPEGWEQGYDEKKAEMAADRAAQEAKMAFYNASPKAETIYDADQVSEAAQSALDNWDFDVFEDGYGIKRQAAMIHLRDHAHEIATSWDIFDFLSEYAESTSADMSMAWARATIDDDLSKA